MADRTTIEWTDATWNPIRGCTRVSEGCRNCYAEVMAGRFSDPGQWGHGLAQRVALPDGSTDYRWTGKVELVDTALDLPLRWRKPRRIFVNSTSDLFHEKVPDEWIDRVFAVMALAPQHTFQVLTKRPERMREYLTRPVQGPWAGRMHHVDDAGRVTDATDAWRRVQAKVGDLLPIIPPQQLNLASEMQEAHGDGFMPRWPLPNLWLGTSIEDQATADERIPHLLATPAAVRFISAEPLLGPVDLTRIVIKPSDAPERGKPPVSINALKGWYGGADHDPARTHWTICGGESGPGARPMHPDWARSLRDQCAMEGVPFFFKQWGAWFPGEVDDKSDGRGLCAHPDDNHDPTACTWEGRWKYTEVADQGFLGVGKNRAGRLLDGREWNEVPNG
jgi:protein gp37